MDGASRNAANADDLDLNDSGTARNLLESSNVSLLTGKGDCSLIAGHHESLGKLARWARQRANKRNAVTCEKVEKDLGWRCVAEFVHKDPRRSEEEFSLMLRFRVRRRAIQQLECFQAG